MSTVNLSDRRALNANSRDSVNYYRRFVEESLADQWHESEWLLAQGYTRNYNNQGWLGMQDYKSNNEEWTEIRGRHPDPPRPPPRSPPRRPRVRSNNGHMETHQSNENNGRMETHRSNENNGRMETHRSNENNDGNQNNW